MKTLALSLLLLTSFLGDIEDNEKQLYKKATAAFEKGNYEEAILKYEELTAMNNTNSEYHFLTGLSYYKSRKDLAKAVEYFNSTIDTFDGDTIAETYYYLGRSYREQGEFTKAKAAFETFEHFLKDNDDGNALRTEIEVEYQWVENALAHEERLKNGLRVEDMSSDLNSVYGDYAPVYVEELDLLAFTSRRPGVSNELAFDNKYYEDIYFCKRRDSNWVLLSDEEHDFIFDIENTDGHDSYIAYESQKDLYIYRENKIFQQRYENGAWTTLSEFELVNDGSKHTPSVSFSPDGNVLYFAHKETTGEGGKDIYFARKNEKNEWSKPKNLAKVNTRFDEDGPFVSRDGKTLYFSSKGHNSMGGFDFFKLDLTDENAEPVRMPEPYNSLADDIFIDISNDERHGFISSNRNGSIGDMDIFEIFYKPYQTKFEGLAVYENDQTPAAAEIIIIDKTTNKEVTRITPDPKTGKYEVVLENSKTYVFNVNGTEDHQAFSNELVVPEQERDINSIQLIALKKIMNEEGQHNANVLAITSDFDNNANTISIENQPEFKAENELVNVILDTIPIELFKMADANFERFFGYNQNEITNEARFNTFLANLEKAIKQESKIVIEIEASASKVPTRTFRTNTRLAKRRAEVPRKKIEAYFKSKNIDISEAIVFNENCKVQGPSYKNDFEKNRLMYEQFQFVKIRVTKAN
ncbi:MAG: tetratricopeptide repeat protein [Flavobacteriales bacterium]|jgi:tetratricopeptide (TPR) repeat protein|nr:tetratricopeptide repeat protein [Flavobacteriales bacterium]